MNFIQLNRGKILFYLFLCIVPLVVWLLAPGNQLLFNNFYSVFTTVGKIAGIVGICFFAGNLFLSGRYVFFDRLFGGLDRVYLFHRRTGIITFILLTIHFGAMTFRSLGTSLADVWTFIIDFSNSAINYGRLAYLGLFIVILITLYIRLKYERLKFLHSFMGVFLFLGGLHAYLIPSDIAANQPLRWYILIIVVLSLLSYLWRTVLKRLLVRRITADVIEVNALGNNVTEVIMKPRGGTVRFIPGQFIFVRFKQSGFPDEEHPFSLTASTEEGRLRISAKALGDFTGVLPQLQPGAIAKIQGPFGGFSFTKGMSKKQVWIAGGIGITPFMSMMRSLRDRVGKEPHLREYDIHLVYSVKKPEELIYKSEIETLDHQFPNFHFHPWISDDQGFMTAEKIIEMTGTKREIFICGPKPLLKALSSQYQLLRVPKTAIHYELFSLLY
jgi:predicted ferric reductase